MTASKPVSARIAQACALALTCPLLVNVVPVPSALAADAPAQTATPAQTAAPDPRTQMTGTWDRYPLLDETPDPAYPPPPPVPDPPLKPEHRAEWDARRKAVKEAEERGQPLFTHYVACIPDGMPAMMMAMFPMEVLQTPGQVTIIQEAYNQVRRIYMNAKLPPIEDAEPGFWGHSSGHWEGDTLVVETIGIKKNVRFRDVPHSSEVRILERLKMLSPDMMQDEVSVTDPVYLTGPWNIKWLYKRRPDYKMQEYVCEANREYQDPENGGTRLHIGK
jgi:hypothetical protein